MSDEKSDQTPRPEETTEAPLPEPTQGEQVDSGTADNEPAPDPSGEMAEDTPISESSDASDVPPSLSDSDTDGSTPDAPEGEALRRAVGVRPRPAGPMEYFWVRHHELKSRMMVVVEAERGLALGQVCTEPFPHEPRPGAQPLRSVVRIADERDKLIDAENKARNREALTLCRDMIQSLQLPMKLIQVEYQHSANKATFFFASEGRVDFRELVRQLAQQLRIRVEMRQIGIRDEAKLLGGLGPCGLPVCCASFLDDFAPVSIRQAKEQNLTLNPEKVSGLCGRLMCCLGYESATYRGEQEGLPKIGKKADTWKGRGRVLEINIFSRLMRMELEGRQYITISIDDYRAFKEDPEGFTKIMAEREEEERRQAVDKLNSGGGGSGGRGRRQDSRPKPAPKSRVRSLADTTEEKNDAPGEARSPAPKRDQRADATPGDEKDEAARRRRSRGPRKRRRKPEDGGDSSTTPKSDQPRREPAARQGSDTPEQGNPERGSGETADGASRPRPRRRGGRRRGGRRPGDAPQGGGSGDGSSGGGSSGGGSSSST